MLSEHLAPSCACEVSLAASPGFCRFSAIWNNACPLLPQGTDLADCRIWEPGTEDLGEKRVMCCERWSLLWLLEGNLFTLLTLASRSILQIVDLGTENKMSISTTDICEVEGTVYILSKEERTPYYSVLDFFSLRT